MCSISFLILFLLALTAVDKLFRLSLTASSLELGSVRGAVMGSSMVMAVSRSRLSRSVVEETGSTPSELLCLVMLNSQWYLNWVFCHHQICKTQSITANLARWTFDLLQSWIILLYLWTILLKSGKIRVSKWKCTSCYHLRPITTTEVIHPCWRDCFPVGKLSRIPPTVSSNYPVAGKKRETR